MRLNQIAIFTGGIALASLLLVNAGRAEKVKDHKTPAPPDNVQIAAVKGLKWIISVQGEDGGWGQDGGATSYIRQNERMESNGNDVANTAVAADAILHSGSTPLSGPDRESLRRAVNFILQHVERSPSEGLAITSVTGTQIQRKLGPYIDTFLTSKLLAELDGNMGDAQSNARVRKGLEKCVAKIQQNQMKDGSWNISGGWAPILGTSMASQSLYMAKGKGVAAVRAENLARVEAYTDSTSTVEVTGDGPVGGRARIEVGASAAGVPLYKKAQELEQLSRTDKDRRKNAAKISAIQGQLHDEKFATGFGSIGGEEFFSYLNISDSLRRTGGPEWEKWNTDTKAKILKMQNDDGTWAGHHCITGRVAVTSAAILTLLADREQVAVPSNKEK